MRVMFARRLEIGPNGGGAGHGAIPRMLTPRSQWQMAEGGVTRNRLDGMDTRRVPGRPTRQSALENGIPLVELAVRGVRERAGRGVKLLWDAGGPVDLRLWGRLGDSDIY